MLATVQPQTHHLPPYYIYTRTKVFPCMDSSIARTILSRLNVGFYLSLPFILIDICLLDIYNGEISAIRPPNHKKPVSFSSSPRTLQPYTRLFQQRSP